MRGDFKSFFKRGLGALVPTLATIGILVWVYRLVDQNFAQYITQLVVSTYSLGGDPHKWLGITEDTALEYGDPVDAWHPVTGRRLTAQYKAMTAKVAFPPGTPSEMLKEAQAELDAARNAAMWDLATRKWKFFNFIGFVIAISIIYSLGYFLASFIGRTTWLIVERLIKRIPLIGTIYPNIKQVTDFFISDKKLEFAGVVAVQYPRKGLWSVGLVTGEALKQIRLSDPRDLMTVFIPSSPTPITGYTITVAREDALELPMTIDDALRYTISGGVVKPSGGFPVGASPTNLVSADA